MRNKDRVKQETIEFRQERENCSTMKYRGNPDLIRAIEPKRENRALEITSKHRGTLGFRAMPGCWMKQFYQYYFQQVRENTINKSVGTITEQTILINETRQRPEIGRLVINYQLTEKLETNKSGNIKNNKEMTN